MHVCDRYTEFWRGTLRAFPEGLAGFASALSSNDLEFATFVICLSVANSSFNYISKGSYHVQFHV
jgi:hypothetical protein